MLHTVSEHILSIHLLALCKCVYKWFLTPYQDRAHYHLLGKRPHTPSQLISAMLNPSSKLLMPYYCLFYNFM